MYDVSSRAKEIADEDFVDPHQPAHQLGPDYVIPTNEFRSWDREGATRIVVADDRDEIQIPESVVSYFRRSVGKYQNFPALSVKRNGLVIKWTYFEYWNAVRVVAKAFIKLGLLPLHGVCILSYNSPEWVFSYLGAIFAGGYPAGIYTTNSAETCFHVLNDSLANLLIVENEAQLQKVLQIRDRLPNLKAIVQCTGQPSRSDVLSWNDLTHIGNSLPDSALERRIKGIAVNQCCNIVYTSGTTGNAKGVMLSHDNILQVTKSLCRDHFRLRECSERLVSYLPFSHMAAIESDIYVAINDGTSVFFAPPDALKGKLVDTLLGVIPTSIFCVPRLLEKICEKMEDAETKMRPFKRNLFKWARGKASKYYTSRATDLNAKAPVLFTLAQKLVLNKVKSAIGFQELATLYCGGAPMSDKVHDYFLSLDLPIIEGYGLSECSGLHTLGKVEDFRTGSVGKQDERNLMEVKLLSPDDDGVGEILLRGRNIFMGYLHLKEQTLEALDDDHWLHTGDLGKFGSDGYLYIVGRIKELIITSGGENIPPVLIECTVKKLIPAISNCVLIGDKRKYLTAFITFQTELDPDTMQPLDKLNDVAIKWSRFVGSSVSSVSEILETKDKQIMTAIQNSITEYNEKYSISNAQRIQKWRILPQDFSIQSGELGPTAKLRRPFILKKYSEIIDEMYSES